MMHRSLVTILWLAAALLLVSCEDDPTWGLEHGDEKLIRFESTLTELEVDSGRDLLYAADELNNVVWMIDMDTDEIVGSVDVGALPVAIEMDPYGEKLFIALEGGDAVVIVDPDSRLVEKRLPLPFEPVFVEPTGDGRVFSGPRILSDGNALSVDIETGEILHEFLSGRGTGVTGAIACDGDSVTVIARGEDLHKWNVTNPDEAVHEVEVELDQYHFDAMQLEILPEKGHVYVSGTEGGTTLVEVYQIIDLIKVGELYTEQPVVYVDLSHGGTRAFVATTMQETAQTSAAATEVLAFDTTTFARTNQYLALGRMLQSSLAVSADDSKLYVVVENPYLIHDNPSGDLRRDIQIISLP
jgi:DNA-binding beta-propeller fold protein YncE